MLYKFKLSHVTVEATENICCANGKSAVDHSTVTKWLRNFPQIPRISLIRHCQVGLKLLILKSWFKP